MRNATTKYNLRVLSVLMAKNHKKFEMRGRKI